ncbi:MAG: M15 family metallopeptidase [Prevotella sp.]|nr:M15 family metallopeptidase [Prevotella sp.]
MPRRCLLLLLSLCAPLMALWAQQGFTVSAIPDSVFARMQGRSFPQECTVKRADLRYLQVLHYDAEGTVHTGELVCNKLIANDLLYIFKKLYEARYPIERMRLIDDYDADDERSMADNNTSCFCFRAISGSKKLSKHAQGLAIDINPLYNPCVKGQTVQPACARKYADRTQKHPYTISRGDRLWQLFTQRGFGWGGSWRSLKDYQHFEQR